MNIGIIGLGLIGGSFAKSIKSQTEHRVTAIDLDKETMILARLCGSIDSTLTQENIKDCDILLLAVCPNAAIEWVKNHAESIGKNAIVIDLCGTKRKIFEELSHIAQENGFTYIGGHPMAGKERGGFVNSSPDLFSGASMILTPDKTADMEALAMLKTLFTDIGFSQLTFSTPEEHDRIIAYTSQLAHITSGAFVKSPTAQNRRGFSAGSFQDMTRVARLDEKMWTELLMDNADFLSKELDQFIEELTKYQKALKEKDSEMLCALLKEGKDKKATAGGN